MQVADVRGVATFADWNNMIDCRRKRMRILVGEIHGLATDPADSLGLKDLEAGGFECPSISFLSVCSNAHKYSGPTLEPAVV